MQQTRWLVAIPVIVLLHAAGASAKEAGSARPLVVQSKTEVFTMDRIYPSMFGPADTDRVMLLETEKPELLWITPEQ